MTTEERPVARRVGALDAEDLLHVESLDARPVDVGPSLEGSDERQLGVRCGEDRSSSSRHLGARCPRFNGTSYQGSAPKGSCDLDCTEQWRFAAKSGRRDRGNDRDTLGKKFARAVGPGPAVTADAASKNDEPRVERRDHGDQRLREDARDMLGQLLMLRFVAFEPPEHVAIGLDAELTGKGFE